MDAPKNCPFCGNNELTLQHGTEDREGVPCQLMCVECGATGPSSYVRPEVLESALNKDEYPRRVLYLWNERASV